MEIKIFIEKYNIFCGTNNFYELKRAIKNYLFLKDFNDRELILRFEETFSNTFKTKYAFTFGAGRMALFASLKALEISKGDEVIIPAFTCVVVPNSIIYSGAQPVYIDINPHDFNIDVNQIEKAITKNTKAIYAQHTFGIPCDIKSIKALAKKYGLFVIEDAAHALGGKLDGKHLGTLGDIGFFSLDHSKMINTHLGGVVVTNNEKISKKLKKIQSESPFLSNKLNRKILRTFIYEFLFFHPKLYKITKPFQYFIHKLNFNFYFLDELKTTMPKNYPYPCRLSSAQSEIGISQISNIENNLFHRRKLAKRLERQIGWYNYSDQEIEKYSWLRYSFLIHNRKEFLIKTNKKLDMGIWFSSVVGGRENDLRKVGYIVGSCKIAEIVCNSIVNFPTHLRIKENLFNELIDENIDWIKYNTIKPKDIIRDKS